MVVVVVVAVVELLLLYAVLMTISALPGFATQGIYQLVLRNVPIYMIIFRASARWLCAMAVGSMPAVNYVNSCPGNSGAAIFF